MTELIVIWIMLQMGVVVLMLLLEWWLGRMIRPMPKSLILRRSPSGWLVFAWFTVVMALLGPGFITMGVAAGLGLIDSEPFAWLIPIVIGCVACWQWWRFARRRAAATSRGTN